MLQCKKRELLIMFIKDKICWKNHLIVTISFLLTTQVLTYPSFAIITEKPQPFQPFTQNATLQDNQNQYLIARSSSNCRQVRTMNGLYVLNQPSITGSVVGFLDYGQDVTIRNRGKNSTLR